MTKLDYYILFITVLIFFIIIYTVRKYFISKTLDRELRQYHINIDTILSEEATNALDQLIDTELKSYILLNTGYEKNPYISEAQEKEIIEYLRMTVSKRLSPVLFQKLSVNYNKKEIPSIIAERIIFSVMNYRIENNSSIRDQKINP